MGCCFDSDVSVAGCYSVNSVVVVLDSMLWFSGLAGLCCLIVTCG